MSKYDTYRTISQLTGIGTEELNKMKKSEMYTIIQKYAPIAEERRDKIVSFFDSIGVEPPFAYGNRNTMGMRSWKLANFNVDMTDSTGKMKSTIRTLQNYLGSNVSSLQGLNKLERDIRTSFAIRAGVPTYTDKKGRVRIKTGSAQYREYLSALERLSTEKYDQPLPENLTDEERRYANRYRGNRVLWEIVDKVKELYKDETKDASSRVQLAVMQSMVSQGDKSISQIITEAVDRLRGEYIEEQNRKDPDAPQYSNYTDFFEE
jgi:hypothetical protein